MKELAICLFYSLRFSFWGLGRKNYLQMDGSGIKIFTKTCWIIVYDVHIRNGFSLISQAKSLSKLPSDDFSQFVDFRNIESGNDEQGWMIVMPKKYSKCFMFKLEIQSLAWETDEEGLSNPMEVLLIPQLHHKLQVRIKTRQYYDIQLFVLKTFKFFNPDQVYLCYKGELDLFQEHKICSRRGHYLKNVTFDRNMLFKWQGLLSNYTKSMIKVCVVLWLSICSALASNHRSYPALSNEITLHGRYYISNSNVAYDWACFKVDFCFKDSTKIVWEVVDSWNIYHVVLDKNITKTIHPKTNTNITVFEAERPESHCMEIIKITQNHYGPYQSKKDSLFIGITSQGGTLVKSMRRYDYNFDFLGDSITTAFGVMSNRNPICFFSMKKIQNCRESWAVHLSNMFNADYRLQAVSGKGVIRNMIGVPGAKMPQLFARLSDNSKDDSYRLQDKYEPDVLFVFIGENDYYYNIKTPSKNKFINGYVSMLERIVQDYMLLGDSVPLIVNVCDIQYSREQCNNVKNAVKDFSYAFQQVHYLEIPQGTIGRERFGCIGHPNAEGQRRIAEALYPQVLKLLEE